MSVDLSSEPIDTKLQTTHWFWSLHATNCQTYDRTLSGGDSGYDTGDVFCRFCVYIVYVAKMGKEHIDLF